MSDVKVSTSVFKDIMLLMFALERKIEHGDQTDQEILAYYRRLKNPIAEKLEAIGRRAEYAEKLKK